jgi:enoyl-CoA hydratase
VLNDPASRNAQNNSFLYMLNEAFDRAAHDDDIKVIILAANGPHFSSGHDLRETDALDTMTNFKTLSTWGGFGGMGAPSMMAREQEIYVGLSERWRNLPKPTIAAVHGKCIAGGLMLAWPCDLIIASEDAQFQDNTGLMGMNGVEIFAHPIELGTRQAKEMLFTGRPITAQEAHAWGMVNKVVPRDILEAEVLLLAQQIAKTPMFALRVIKQAINAGEDAAGRPSTLQIGFSLHQLLHSHNMREFGYPIDPTGAPGFPSKQAAAKPQD